MSYNKLLKKIEEHISSFYIEQANPTLVYHTFSQAKEMVNWTEKICNHHQLDEHAAFIICAAAWFHKTGYIIGNFELYELKSVELAEAYFRNTDIIEEDIHEIKKCIASTRNPGGAVTLNEKIICDANTFYFGTDKFKEHRKLLKKELEAIKGIKIGKKEWREETIKMLEQHQYQTEYCKSLLDKTKEEHLHKLKLKQSKNVAETSSAPVLKTKNPTKLTAPPPTTETKKIPPSEQKPKRGIETMFRISSSNSQKISMMADNKANIMISVNSIIMSVVLGLMVGKLDENRYLIIPTIILLAVNVGTIIYSVLATRPKATKGIFTPEQVEKKSANLLFYGSFYNMDIKEYHHGMKAMMDDREFLYGSLIRDIYWQGKVLGRKYRLLRIAYNIFMYGIAVAVVAYTIATMIHVM